MEEFLQKEKTKAIVGELLKEKPYYVKIFGWLYLNCCTPTLVADAVGISKSTAFDDIKKVKRIAAEVYRRFD